MASDRAVRVAEKISRHMPVWVMWPEAERIAAIARALDEEYPILSETNKRLYTMEEIEAERDRRRKERQ